MNRDGYHRTRLGRGCFFLRTCVQRDYACKSERERGAAQKPWPRETMGLLAHRRRCGKTGTLHNYPNRRQRTNTASRGGSPAKSACRFMQLAYVSDFQ
jgi:hypothetical protein